MSVLNEESRSQVAKLFELAADLEEQVMDMITELEQVQNTLSRLANLYPESLSYGCFDGGNSRVGFYPAWCPGGGFFLSITR